MNVEKIRDLIFLFYKFVYMHGLVGQAGLMAVGGRLTAHLITK
jgi:hypothetical protein